MAFLSCDHCGWGQDDFWEEDGWTPLRADAIDFLGGRLFEDRVHFDPSFFRGQTDLTPDGVDERGPWVDGRKYVAWDLRRRAAQIEGMVFRTQEEWERRTDAGKWACPECRAEDGLSVD
jgi:hypothetical protein